MEISKLLLIYLLFQSIQNSEDSDIVFVFEHARHGARSPLFADGNTNYTDHFGTKWEGASMLTSVGIRTHYVIGVHNRKKYGSLINFSKFDTKEIEVFSTNSGRVLQSIQAELQAMYLPGTLGSLSQEQLNVALPPMKNISSNVTDEIKEINNSTIIYGINVFPIKFSAPTKTRLNAPENCPYMSKYQAQLEKDIQNATNIFLKDFDEKFGEQLQKYLNLPNRDIILNDFYFTELILADEYISNYYEGSDLTDFLSKTNIDKEEFFKYCAESKNYYIFHIDIDEKTGIMAASPTMKDVVNYMENIINNKTGAPKMVIHGGHDNTVSYILYFMQKAFNIPISFVPFAATVYFELHRNVSDYYVEYIYDGETLMKKDFNEFKEKVLETVWSQEQINNFCYPKDEGEKPETENDNDKYKTLNVVLIAFTAVFFILTVIFLVLFIFYYKVSKNSNRVEIKGSLLTKEKDNNELNAIYTNY